MTTITANAPSKEVAMAERDLMKVILVNTACNAIAFAIVLISGDRRDGLLFGNYMATVIFSRFFEIWLPSIYIITQVYYYIFLKKTQNKHLWLYLAITLLIGFWDRLGAIRLIVMLYQLFTVFYNCLEPAGYRMTLLGPVLRQRKSRPT